MTSTLPHYSILDPGLPGSSRFWACRFASFRFKGQSPLPRTIYPRRHENFPAGKFLRMAVGKHALVDPIAAHSEGESEKLSCRKVLRGSHRVAIEEVAQANTGGSPMSSPK
jgi:hypothetical protein